MSWATGCPASPWRRARSVRPRSATEALSAATWAPPRRPMTTCPLCLPRMRSLSSHRRPALATSPCVSSSPGPSETRCGRMSSLRRFWSSQRQDRSSSPRSGRATRWSSPCALLRYPSIRVTGVLVPASAPPGRHRSGRSRRRTSSRASSTGRAGQWPVGRDGRRSGRRHGPASVCGSRGGAVRLLHAGPGGRRARPAGANAASHRCADPRGAGGQHLPLHRVRKDPRRGAQGRRLGMRIGESVLRHDGAAKVRGDFAYSSDLHVEGMLWGATVRSPHPYARILSIDPSEARATAGVRAVLTHDDVPGQNLYGLEIKDQPVLASDVVRYWGEPVALVAADHPEQARRAAEKLRVEYEVLRPITDAELALSPDAPKLHPDGNVTRQVRIRHGDQAAHADVVVRGEYEIGMQDQAPLGPESGLAIPDGYGGVDLHIATQWLHVDQEQLANILDLPKEKVRLTMAGIGGAFGAREDLSMQAHACLLALKTGRPVKISYSRPESFVGHVHRHPGRLTYEHGANRDGKVVYLRARIVLDGGAYASSSTAVIANATCFSVGPYVCPNATVDGIVVYTNNPPCGAMRGFGSVQNCYAHEAQMDKLAAALGIDPVEMRLRNAMETGSEMITGQVIDGPVPVAELLRRVRAFPMPDGAQLLPGGYSNTTHGEGVKRGVGYAVGFKNIGYSEGFDDYSTARVRLFVHEGKPRVEVHTAAAEVGQGVVLVQAQVAGSERGVNGVGALEADTRVGSACWS